MQTAVQVPQVQIQPQPLVQQQAVGMSSGERHDYNAKSAMALGSLQLGTGVLCVILQTVAIVLGSQGAFIGSGIWCGILFIISGAIGMGSSCKKTAGLIITFMVMSIISAVFIIALVSCAGISVAIDNAYRCIYYNYSRSQCLPDTENAKIAMNSLLLILAICELVFAIWSSALGCKTYCCHAPRPQVGTVLQMQYIQPGQPHAVFLGQGQALPNQQTTVFVQGAPGHASPHQAVMVQQPIQQNTPLVFSSPMGMQQTSIGNSYVQQPQAAKPPVYEQLR